MTSDENSHQFVQEILARSVVREQSVTVDVVELTLAGMGEAEIEIVNILGSIQTQQVVEPFFDWIILAISDGLIKLSLHKSAVSKASCGARSLLSDTALLLLSQTVNKLKGKTSSSAFIAMNCR